MRASQSAPLPGKSIIVPLVPNVVKVVTKGLIIRGRKYRVVSTQDVWLTVDSQNPVLPDPLVITDTVVDLGVFLPAKTPEDFTFASVLTDNEQENDYQPIIKLISAFPAMVFFTPVRMVPTE